MCKKDIEEHTFGLLPLSSIIGRTSDLYWKGCWLDLGQSTGSPSQLISDFVSNDHLSVTVDLEILWNYKSATYRTNGNTGLLSRNVGQSTACRDMTKNVLSSALKGTYRAYIFVNVTYCCKVLIVINFYFDMHIPSYYIKISVMLVINKLPSETSDESLRPTINNMLLFIRLIVLCKHIFYSMFTLNGSLWSRKVFIQKDCIVITRRHDFCELSR
jgi:hypothetical protein